MRRGGWAPWSPEKIRATRVEAEIRLRRARKAFDRIDLRMQPYVRAGQNNRGLFACLVGEALIISVDEAIDVWELLRDTRRFWQSWRPLRRRSSGSQAATAKAWEAWERAAADPPVS